MKTVFASALVAATFAIASPAMAATEIPLSPTGIGFFNAEHAAGSYTDEFFFNTGSGTVASSVITLNLFGTAAIKLTSVILNGTALNVVFANGEYSASGSVATKAPNTLSIGSVITDDANPATPLGTASYSGQVKFTTSAVPEPATWALMILGFGVVGYSLRRRPAVRFAQAI